MFRFYRREELSNNSIIIAIAKSDDLFQSKFYDSFKTPFPPKPRTVAYTCVLSTQLYAASIINSSDGRLTAQMQQLTAQMAEWYGASVS